MIRQTLIDLNPIELNYYPFIISLEKFNESCNAVVDLSTKICVLGETKDVNVKVFNMVPSINEIKTVKHISWVINAYLIVQHQGLIQDFNLGGNINVSSHWSITNVKKYCKQICLLSSDVY